MPICFNIVQRPVEKPARGGGGDGYMGGGGVAIKDGALGPVSTKDLSCNIIRF